MASLLKAILADGGRQDTLWGVDLCRDTPERLGVLTKFEDARDGDAAASLNMLDNALAWRRTMNIGNFRLRPPLFLMPITHHIQFQISIPAFFNGGNGNLDLNMMDIIIFWDETPGVFPSHS
jgi:hypothetical protein